MRERDNSRNKNHVLIHKILTKNNINTILAALGKVEYLAGAGKIRRFLHHPGRYLFAVGFRAFVYPRTRKGVFKTAHTFMGHPMTVALPAGTDLYLTGGKTHDSEIRLARFMIRHLREGGVFWDVGAHFGYFSLLAAHLVGEDAGAVLAFEASGGAFQILQANTRNLKNIQTFHKAVSDAPGLAAFYEFPVLYSEYNTLDVGQFEQENWFQKFKPAKTEVQATTLDAQHAAVPRPPDVIKIDVEGAEYRVLRGAAKLLTAHRPYVVMEYLEARRGNAAHQKAAELLLQLGFKPNHITAAGDLAPLADIDRYLTEHRLDSDNVVFFRP
jgi:FkbM family methyltransferase